MPQFPQVENRECVNTYLYKVAYCIKLLFHYCANGWLNEKLTVLQFWRLEVWVLAGLVSFDVFWGLLVCWQSWCPDLCIHLHMVFSQCVLVGVLISPFYKETSHTGLGVHSSSVWPHFDLINYICNALISKESHILRCLDLRFEFWEIQFNLWHYLIGWGLDYISIISTGCICTSYCWWGETLKDNNVYDYHLLLEDYCQALGRPSLLLTLIRTFKGHSLFKYPQFIDSSTDS